MPGEHHSLLNEGKVQSDAPDFVPQADLDEKTGRLLKVLQRKGGSNSEDKKMYNTSPDFEGTLSKKSKSFVAGVEKWKKFHFTLNGTNLFYYKKRSQVGGKPTGCIPISFCTVDKLAYNKDEIQDIAHEGEFLNMVEDQTSRPIFRIYSRRQLFFLRAENEAKMQAWIKAISNNLDDSLGEDELEAKTIAAKNLEPLLKRQMYEQFKRSKFLMQVLADVGFGVHYHPLTDSAKEKEGYLETLGKDDIDGKKRWKKYYFVLLHGTMYYYKSSKDEEPAGVLSLVHAKVSLSKKSIQKHSFVIKVKTCYRTLYLKAKHESAMADWLAKIDHSRSVFRKGEGDSERSLVGDMTRYMKKRDWKHLKDFIEDRLGRKQFKKFLHKEGELNLFKFYRDVSDFKKRADGTSKDLTEKATNIYTQYVANGAEREIDILRGLKGDIKEAIANKDWINCFTLAAEMAKQSLRDDWLPKMKKSYYYEDLLTMTQRPEDVAETFVGEVSVVVYFEAEKKHYPLKSGFTTMGRDSSMNDIPLNDPRSSRAHCKFELTDGGQVIVSDLGSSSGTKVNGKRIVRAGLKSSDEVNIGNTIIRIKGGSDKK